MTFYTRIPFAFWLLTFAMTFITYGVLNMPEIGLRSFLITCVTFYWGFTAILLGLAFTR